MKTTGKKLGGGSRFAPLDPLLLDMFHKYPSRGGANIDFPRAFADSPDFEKKVMAGETLSSVRSHSADLIRRHLRVTNGGPALAKGRGGQRPATSRYAGHEELFHELLKKYPTRNGKISFRDAFDANPSLRDTLGVHTPKDLHSCAQYANKVVGTPVKKTRGPYTKRRSKQEAVVRESASEPPPTASFCWNCGAPHAPVNQALALMARLKK